MNENTRELLRQYRHEIAIIVYKAEDESYFGGNYYLESHEFNSKGELLEGKPLRQETIQGIVDVFFDERQNQVRFSGILPPCVLQFDILPGGHYAMMWHRPASRRQLFFTNSLGIPSGKAWVPAMVFKVIRRDLYVFAVQDDERPFLSTELFHAPFHNIAADGHVCLGSAKARKPEKNSYESIIAYWEDMFWLSEFSHLAGAQNPTKSNLSTLWRRLMKDKNLKWSDLKEMKSKHVTLQSIL